MIEYERLEIYTPGSLSNTSEIVQVNLLNRTALSVCKTCGAVVADKKLHTEWHEPTLEAVPAKCICGHPRPCRPDDCGMT